MRRRAAPNRQAAGVSLFPFLAVLLCTMGALIVVLVVIARQAHLQVAAAAQLPPDGELTIKRADLEWRISQLRDSREATKKLLAEKQTELSHFEEHSRRLRAQLEELEAARERLSEIAAGDTRNQAKLKNELERLQYRVAGLRGELGKLIEKARQGQESYAIIPYHGPNETYRRPIYIECSANGVVLQPAGLVLTEQDFVIDSGPSNPLAAALRAAREYYLRNSLSGQGDTGSAYPLMIVRPDGVLAYIAARNVLQSWGPDFGYELVAQDWQIEYPPADPMLVLAMKQAISEGRRGQAYLASAAPGLFYNSRHLSFRAAPHGGLMAGGGSALGGIRRAHVGGRPASVAGGTRRLPGEGSGSSGAGDNPYLDALAEEGSESKVQGSGSPGPGGGNATSGGRNRGSVVGGPGGIGGIGIGGSNAGDPLLASAVRPASGGQGSGFRSQGSAFAGRGTGPGGQGSMMPGVGPGGVGHGSGNTGGAGNNPTASFAGGTGNKPVAASRPATAAGNIVATSGHAGNLAQAGSALATDGEGATTGGQASGGPSGANGSQRSAASGAGSDGLNGAGDSPATATGGTASNARSSSVGQLASTTRGGSAAGSASAGGPSDGNSSRGSSRGGSSNGGSASGSNSAAAGAGTPGGGSMGSAVMQPGQMGMPMPTISMGAQPPDPNSSSSRGGKRERNWANPDASTMNVPIERRIRIVCDAEHLTVMPDGRAARGMKIIKLGTHTEDSLDELVSTVWDRIDSWGTAGRGMYWRPKLVMTIEPGGQRRYTELQALLADSGFDVHGRPRTAQRRTR